MKAQDEEKQKTYSLKFSMVYVLLLSLMAIGLFYGSVAIIFFSSPFSIFIFIIFFILLITLIINISYSAMYDDTSVAIDGLFHTPKSIHWNEIKAIKAGIWPNVIGLMDDHGSKLLSLNKNMNNFEHFVELLSQKCPNLYRHTLNEPIKGNYKNRILLILFFIIIIGVYTSLLEKSISITTLIVVGVIVLMLIWSFLFNLHEITPKKDGLLLRYLKKNKDFRIDDIKSIEYKNVYSNRGQRFYQVLLITHQGEYVYLNLLGMNNVILFLYLRNWFEENRRRHNHYPGRL